MLPDSVKSLMIRLVAMTQHRRVTDGRTDRHFAMA